MYNTHIYIYIYIYICNMYDIIDEYVYIYMIFKLVIYMYVVIYSFRYDTTIYK